MPSSAADPDNMVAAAAAEIAAPSSPACDERLLSSLRTQAAVDALCGIHGLPSAYAARPAGDDRRAWTRPPPGSVCVYAHALEAGMRVPLHGFFCQVLAHFGIAPTQLVPNAWRVMAGFLALCDSVGAPPSLAVFRCFFELSIVNRMHKGWYCFRATRRSGLRFAGMPVTPMGWKNLFFFLSSPEPWPCPVEWGEPSGSSFVIPALTIDEQKSAEKLLRAYAGAAVDINSCLGDGSNRAIDMVTAASPPPPLTPPSSSSSTRITSGSSSKGMDPSVYDMMKTILAEKAAAQASASAKKVKAEPGGDAPVAPPLCRKKSGPTDANGEEGPPIPAPGFSRKPHHIPTSRPDGDATDWEAARQLLQAAVAPPLEREFAAHEPSHTIRSSYAAILQAANHASFSLGHALELERKLAAQDAEVAALREQLEWAKAELAAVQHLPGSEERELEGHGRWRDGSSADHVVTASPATATSTPTTQPMIQRPDGRRKRECPFTKYDPKEWVVERG